MQPQIAHADEIHRHHPRHRLPIEVEVDGIRHRVGDWSIGGFAVEAEVSGHQAGERLPVRLLFVFDDFEMVMRFEVRLVYVDRDPPRFGCTFVGISRQQMAVFRYLINTYLSGELVCAAEVLRIRPREPCPGKGMAADEEPEPLALPEPLPAPRRRRPALLAAGGLIALGLAALAGLALL
jgi:mannuronan synthase